MLDYRVLSNEVGPLLRSMANAQADLLLLLRSDFVRVEADGEGFRLVIDNDSVEGSVLASVADTHSNVVAIKNLDEGNIDE